MKNENEEWANSSFSILHSSFWFWSGGISFEVRHRIFEQAQPFSFLGKSKAGPLGMLRGQDVALGVRHEAKHTTGGIADAGNVSLRAVGIDRIRPRFPFGIDIAQDNLASLLKSPKYPIGAADEVALSVSYWQVQALIAF